MKYGKLFIEFVELFLGKLDIFKLRYGLLIILHKVFDAPAVFPLQTENLVKALFGAVLKLRVEVQLVRGVFNVVCELLKLVVHFLKLFRKPIKAGKILGEKPRVFNGDGEPLERALHIVGTVKGGDSF